MSDKQKNTTIIVLLIGLAFVSYIAFFKNPEPINDALIEAQKKELHKQNDSLFNEINVEKKKQTALSARIDSLQNLKPKIVIKYVEKSHQIDNANSANIVSEFDSLFAKNNLR